MAKDRFVDITGEKFGRLTVVGFLDKDKYNNYLWDCLCTCGKRKTIRGSHLKSKGTKSCGCLGRDNKTIHGFTGTHIFNTWQCMIQRCTNPNNDGYKNYGGRGISVCDKWLNFEAFYKDMGEIPKDKSLDRINNDGNYCKDNCRWATQKEQHNNTRTNIFLTYNNKKQTLSQWANELKVSRHRLYYRIYKLKWSIEKTLSLKWGGLND